MNLCRPIHYVQTLFFLAGLLHLSGASQAQDQVGSWKKLDPMTEGRYAPTATLLPAGTFSPTEDAVLIAGGFNGRTLASAVVYTPSLG